MTFRTKLDYSNNRQIKQFEKTNTHLSGATTFGLPFSGLTNGPNYELTGLTSQYINIISEFSGNSSSTLYYWGVSGVDNVESLLSAITPSISAITQDTDIVFSVETSTVIDGNVVNLTYSGVSVLNHYVLNMIEVSPNNYTGSVSSDIYFYSAGTTDFTDRTIWVDNKGILKTEKLIVSDRPTIGYVLKCLDSDGLVGWLPDSSGVTVDVLWSASTGINSLVPKYSNNVAMGNNSMVIGGNNITGFSEDTVYVPNLVVDNNQPSFFGINKEPSKTFDIDSYDGRSNFSYYDDNTSSPSFDNFQTVYLSGDSDMTMIIGCQTAKNLDTLNHGIQVGVIGEDNSLPSSDRFGKPTDAFVYASGEANFLNIINSPSPGGSKYDAIRFYAGLNVDANVSHVHICGSGVTKGFVGIGVESPTELLDVNGNGRFRVIGSSSSSGALHYTSDGTLTTSTSDFRLKTNITPINNALNKVLKLNGVKFNWRDNLSVDRFGFIAQDVEKVSPELTFINQNSDEKFMGVHYDNVTPLLVEAIKELYQNKVTKYFEVQTVLSEDNNIELNYNGNHYTSMDGGLIIKNGVSDGVDSKFIIDGDGNWRSNTLIKSDGFVLPKYNDTFKNNLYTISCDDEYLYINTNKGVKKVKLENI